MSAFAKQRGWKIPHTELIARHKRREKLSPEEKDALDKKLLHMTGAGVATQVHHCLEAGANPDALDAKGNSALMRAARGGHPDTARALLESWATPNFSNNRESPITFAIVFGKANTADVIREYLPAVLDAETQAAIQVAANNTHPMSRKNIKHWVWKNFRKPGVLAP